MTDDVLLGLGGTVDYEVRWNSAVLEDLVLHYGIGAHEIDSGAPVLDERDLVRSILGFLRDGAGGELFVDSASSLQRFAERFDTEITLGGTSVRAALAMDRLGVASTVHLVSTNEHVRRLLPGTVTAVSSAVRDSIDPHLIVQFGAGATVRAGDIDIRAPHSNRIIYVNDPPNRHLLLSPRLRESFASAELILLSGLNTIQDGNVLKERLSELNDLLDLTNTDALVAFEDAGYHVPAFARRVVAALAPRVDAWSMNEDEVQTHLQRSVDLLDPDDLIDALTMLRTLVRTPTLIVHTKYWAVAIGADARRWRIHLAGGVQMAGARYMFGNHASAAEYADVASGPAHERGLAVVREVERRLGSEVAGQPAFDLHSVSPTTIGLGDAFVGGVLASLAQARGIARIA